MIFSNFVGTSRDFDTLIHEGGHAMHGFLSRHLSHLERNVPLEFAEVASMSLELLARPYWDIVYSEDDRRRLGIKQLEHDLCFLPFMACIDEFQHWVYTHPDGESAEKRAEFWHALEDKYRPHVDYSGLEREQDTNWQYLHVYEVPFYYIEYGVAQVGAQQVYLRSLEDYDGAVRDYMHALSLGATVGLPELFEAAGVKFVLKHPEVLEPTVNRIMEQIGLG
jgi:oligoendopeptidase F